MNRRFFLYSSLTGRLVSRTERIFHLRLSEAHPCGRRPAATRDAAGESIRSVCLRHERRSQKDVSEEEKKRKREGTGRGWSFFEMGSGHFTDWWGPRPVLFPDRRRQRPINVHRRSASHAAKSGRRRREMLIFKGKNKNGATKSREQRKTEALSQPPLGDVVGPEPAGKKKILPKDSATIRFTGRYTLDRGLWDPYVIQYQLFAKR